MKYIIAILVFIIYTNCFAQTGEVVSNKTIISLHKAGFSKEVLISKIQTSVCSFDLSTDGLIALKNEKVPDEVLTAMLAKGNTPSETTSKNNILSPGIYYYDSTHSQYTELDPSILTNQKSGGLGESLKRSVTGLFNAKLKASLSGSDANLVFKTNTPVFTFVFDSVANSFGNSSSIWAAAQSPNEFFLVKLKVSKNSREVVVGKENNLKSNIGIDDDVKIKFISRKIQKGVYEVSTERPLKDGEYCFMFSASSLNAGSSHKVYDFSVK